MMLMEETTVAQQTTFVLCNVQLLTLRLFCRVSNNTSLQFYCDHVINKLRTVFKMVLQFAIGRIQWFKKVLHSSWWFLSQHFGVIIFNGFLQAAIRTGKSKYYFSFLLVSQLKCIIFFNSNRQHTSDHRRHIY